MNERSRNQNYGLHSYNLRKGHSPDATGDRSRDDIDFHEMVDRQVEVDGRRKPTTSIPKIKILSHQIYEPIRIDLEMRNNYHRLYGNDSLLLLFNSDSCKKLKCYIGWGYQITVNHVEQGGILLGHVYRYKGEIFSFVEDCILANSSGSTAFVEFTPEIWSVMQQELCDLNKQRDKDKHMAIIGWFHTHPNGLSVFMSATDQYTQEKNFPQDWQVSVVINPHKMRLKAFFGKDMRDGLIVGWDATPMPRKQQPCCNSNEDDHQPSIVSRLKEETYRLNIELRDNDNRFVQLKKKQGNYRRIWLIALTVSFMAGICIGKIPRMASDPNAGSSELPAVQTSTTPQLQVKETSLVLFSLVYEKWTSLDRNYQCRISVKQIYTHNKAPYEITQCVKCNSDNAYIELPKGLYTIEFSDLPILADGTVFKDITPVTVIVDGVKPKLIMINLKAKEKEAPSPINETETVEPTPSLKP